MINESKVLILPNKGNIPTMKEVEKKYDLYDRFCTYFLFKKKNIPNTDCEKKMVHPEIKNHYVKF